MAFIAINELRATGAELFQDSESYLTDLNQLDAVVHGGESATSAGFGFGGTATVLGLVTKGYEFGVYTLGIEGIAHIVKSFSYGGYSSAA